jgi:hypothetical protein
MNTNVQNNAGAASEAAVVAQNTNKTTFAEKAKVVALAAKDMAGSVAFGTIATACAVSSVVCATYRVVKLVRLLRGDEK